MSDIHELLKQLHQDYLNALPDKLKTIRSQAEASDVDSLRDSFHKLKGTGRTYGMPEVSELAEVVEQLCKTKPTHASQAAATALMLLSEIHAHRVKGEALSLSGDNRYLSLRQLLPAP